MDTRIKKKDEPEVIKLIEDHYSLAKECENRVEEAKIKYQAVTSYLVDIQKIDRIPKEERGEVSEAARRIVNLTREREEFQKGNSKLTPKQMANLERYEDKVMKDLLTIKECEAFKGKIFEDVKHLKKDRHELVREKDKLRSGQNSLKGVAIITLIVMGALFAFFIILSNRSKINLETPFFMTILMGAVSSIFIFVNVRKNIYKAKVLEMRLNKNILLMNRVKIKASNNENYLEYMYIKYLIKNGEMLERAWIEYIRLKDASKIYKENTELLEFYNGELIKLLNKFGVEDSEVWIYQPIALINDKEIVEVRHRLNLRRQNARESIEENQRQGEEALKEVDRLTTMYPQFASEVKNDR